MQKFSEIIIILTFRLPAKITNLNTISSHRMPQKPMMRSCAGVYKIAELFITFFLCINVHEWGKPGSNKMTKWEKKIKCQHHMCRLELMLFLNAVHMLYKLSLQITCILWHKSTLTSLKIMLRLVIKIA